MPIKNLPTDYHGDYQVRRRLRIAGVKADELNALIDRYETIRDWPQNGLRLAALAIYESMIVRLLGIHLRAGYERGRWCYSAIDGEFKRHTARGYERHSKAS